MESKKINQLATNLAPVNTDLTVIGDPLTGELKKITLLQIASIFGVGIGSIGMVVPSGFSVSPSTLTANGTFTISGAGTTAQYIRGDGSLATFPTFLSSDKLIQEVRNNSGATMLKGTIVYIDGAVGNKATIAKALASSDATSAQTYGVVQDDIANNSNGYIVIVGEVTGLDTSAVTEGQQLYLSGSIAGFYTVTKPYAPIHLVYVAIVLRSHPTLGILGVKIQNGYEMDELHNVDAVSPSNNDGLFYNTTTSLWEHKPIATVLGYTPVTSARTISTTSPLSGGGDLTADRTLAIAQSTTSVDGYLSATDWNTFNGKQGTITLTTTGTSGAATFISNTLNIPQYSGTNIYNADGTLTGNRTLTSGGYNLTFTGSNTAASAIARGVLMNHTLVAAANSDVLVGLDINPTFTLGAFTGVTTADLRLNNRLFFQSVNWRLGDLFTDIQHNAGLKISSTNVGAHIIFRGIGYTTYMQMFNNTGNLLLQNGGTFTDGGQRLQVTGTSYFSDSVGIGITPNTNYGIRLARTITSNVDSNGISSEGQVQSDVTSSANIFNSVSNTQNASFTITGIRHYRAVQGTFGASSVVTNQFGFLAESNLTGATNNFAFYGNIASGTGRWNLYMNGTAYNYMAGNLGIGNASLTTTGLRVSPNITGGTIAINVYSDGTIQSDVTSQAFYFRTQLRTAATVFTLANAYHYQANGGTLGTGSVITNQYGFVAEATLTQATNNYGFYGAIASGTNRWNLYMAGTANNYMAGNLLLGTTTDAGYKLDVNGTARVSGALTTNQGIVIDRSTSPYIQFQSSATTWGYVRATGLSTIVFNDNANTTMATINSGGLTLGSPTINTYRINASTNAVPVFFFERTVLSTTNAFSEVGRMQSTASTIEMIDGFGSYISFFARDVTAVNNEQARVGAIRSGADNSASLVFYTNNAGTITEKWRINNTGVLSNVSSPNASAVTQIDSTTQGFLPPRMTTTQKNAIATPAAGLVVYDSTLNKLCVYTTAWETITSL